MKIGRQFQEIPGQTSIPVSDTQRFKGKETDRYDKDFHKGPSAHVDVHGFTRDNTVTNRKAYSDVRQNPGVWREGTKMTLHPHTQVHTLQGADETSRISHKDPEVAALNPPKVLRVRGALVIVDGHHRIAAARKAGEPIEVHYHDTDQHKYGKPLHELYGI